jgi:hypothetical protein
MKNFIIEYTIKNKSGAILKNGKMKVKNKMTSLDAQIKFEVFLKKKYNNFGQLIVHECYEENSFNNIFGDILGKDNSFKF